MVHVGCSEIRRQENVHLQEEQTMKLQINVKTPKGQAESCIKTQRNALLGFKKSKQILEEKMLSDHEFYWVIPCEDTKEMMKIHKKLSRGEVFIKQFYKSLFKLINKANKLATKFDKGTSWIRKWMIKKLRGTYEEKEEGGLIQQIQNMTDEEIKDFIKINDEREMKLLLAGELITVKET